MLYLIPFIAAYAVYVYTYRRHIKKGIPDLEKKIIEAKLEYGDMENADIIIEMLKGVKDDVGAKFALLTDQVVALNLKVDQRDEKYSKRISNVEMDLVNLKTKSNLKGLIWSATIGGGFSVITAIIITFSK